MTDDVDTADTSRPGGTLGPRAGCLATFVGLGLCCLVVLGATAAEAWWYIVGSCLGGCTPEVQRRVDTRFVHHMLLASLCIPVAMVVGMWLVGRSVPPDRRVERDQPS